jgi:hypothetical protein
VAQDGSVISVDAEEFQNVQNVLLEAPDPKSKSLPWLDMSDNAFCSVMTHLLSEDQTHRHTLSALNVLWWRLQALEAPASNTLLRIVIQAGKHLPVAALLPHLCLHSQLPLTNP